MAMEKPVRNRSTMAAGGLLGAASLLEVVAMAHHPSVQPSDVLEVARAIGARADSAALVHGVLIALMLVITYGCAAFASRRGLARPLIGMGAVFYGAGVVTMIGAALINGFILADLARSLPHSAAADKPGLESMFILCRVVNQTCAKFGVVAMSAGVGCWSIDLLRTTGPARWVGAWGIFAGGSPMVALLTGWGRLDVHGMTQVVVLDATWYAAMACLLVSSTLSPGVTPR